MLKLKIKIINIIFSFFKNKYLTEIKNIENKYSDYWIFMPLHCIGDLLMFCRNLKAFKAVNGGKVVVIVKDKQRQDFVKLFNSVDETVIFDEKLYFYGLYGQEPVFNKNIEKGKVHLISADFITKTINTKFETPKDLYRFVLNLSSDNLVQENPIYTKENILEVDKILKNMNLCKKIIFLAPFAKSLNYKVLSKDFWTNLADKLINTGYDVVFNARESDFPKYKCLFLPISQVGIFVSKCYACVAFRSGLADIVSLTPPEKFYVIYPKLMDHPSLGLTQRNVWKNTYNFNPNLSDEENMYRLFSFESIVGKSSAEEIIFDDKENVFNEMIYKKIIGEKE